MVEKSEISRPTWLTLNDYEKLAKILSLIAVPVILAIGGWALQDSLSKRDVNQQYVSLSVSILTESESAELRGWAVEMLNKHSPVPLSPQIQAKLTDGSIRLPGGIEFLIDLRDLVSNTRKLLSHALESNPTPEERRELDHLMLRFSEEGARNDARLQALIAGKRVMITETEAGLLESLEKEIVDTLEQSQSLSVARVRDLAGRVVEFLERAAPRIDPMLLD